MSQNKKKLGQFFTITNPFFLNPFIQWMNKIPNISEELFLEPFAGANNIVAMVKDLGFKQKWACYDIEPVSDELKADPSNIEQRDCFSNFPKGFNIAITNPPYLARNSATRMKLEYPNTEYDDLYKHSLSLMLSNVKYVAAIIPESFITQNLFHNRLHSVISLTCKMFSDTECPVCLALFVPEDTKKSKLDFEIYQENQHLGSYLTLKKNVLNLDIPNIAVKFNDPQGNLGLKAIDSQSSEAIEFVKGAEISAEIKVSSRSLTKISIYKDGLKIEDESFINELIYKLNSLLTEHRILTKDVFMTAFKGLRKDGKYRRRLDFSMAKKLIVQGMVDAGT